MTDTSLNSTILEQADAFAREGQADRMLGALRALSLQQFGELFLQPPAGYPHLAAAIPEMASDEVQNSWTGTHGERLLAQSLEFVRTMEAGYRKISGRAMADTDILDFGCGWGRIMRLMLRYTPPSKLYGVDPWDESLRLCRERNLPGQLALSDYVPRSLPFGEQKFDLIYAYSVFTHLSPKTAGIAQQTLLDRLNKDGVLVMTVRPEIYWRGHHYWPEGCTPESMMALHRANGIAYIPHIRPPIDGDITFGDTSIAQEYIRREWKGWKLVEAMPLAQDPMQHVLFLRPRSGIRGWFSR